MPLWKKQRNKEVWCSCLIARLAFQLGASIQALGADYRAITLMGGGRGIWQEHELLRAPESTQQLSSLQA